EEIHAPLPVVEANGAGDDLPNFSGVAAANHAMLIHLAGTFFDWQRVPILVFAPAAIHRIKTNVAVFRDFGKKARAHGIFLSRDGVADLAIPLFAVRFHASVG